MNIGTATQLYIQFRKSIGRKDKSFRYKFGLFARYVHEDKELDDITEDDCVGFLHMDRTNLTADSGRRYSALVQFFQWAVIRGYTSHNPMQGVVLPRIPDYYPPYIYSKEELKAIFDGALAYTTPKNVHPPINDQKCVRFILMITYFLGLRISETLNIKIKDVDKKSCAILIEESKCYKSRFVTYNQQIGKLLEDVFSWRGGTGFSMDQEAYLFINRKGKPVNLITLHFVFQEIRKIAKLEIPERGKLHQPRIHDLRHTFAVNVLTSWYRSGRDVQTLLPKLTTYLGHDRLSYTSTYLTKTPALLLEANKLFHKYVNQENE